MGTILKVGLKIWSFLDFFGTFWASRTPQNFLKKNKIVCNIKVDVWEEKCDISLKDRSISLKALIFFTPWPEVFPVAWTMAQLACVVCAGGVGWDGLGLIIMFNLNLSQVKLMLGLVVTINKTSIWLMNFWALGLQLG